MDNIIKDAKKLGTAIKSIGTRGKQLDTDIHNAGVSCLYHAEQHGDVTLLTRLVEAMPKSGRAKALVAWAEHFGLVTFNKEEKRFKVTKPKNKQWDLEGANDVPFWEFTEEKEVGDLTIDALVKMVVNKVQKASDNGKLKEGFTMQGLKTKLTKGLNEVTI